MAMTAPPPLQPAQKPRSSTDARSRALSLLGALTVTGLACITPPPSALAVSFTDGDTSSNPFYFNGTASSWTLESTSTNPLAEPEVTYDLNTGDVQILSSGESGTVDTWTSTVADHDYTISFAFAFNIEFGSPEAYYQIDNKVVKLSGESDKSNVSLLAGQTLIFGINNEDGAGDLTISNFNATPVPVPAPLPLLGAGAAFGWIRRLRAQLKARQLGRQ